MIRRAEGADLPRMVEMGRAFFEEGALAGFATWEDESVREALAAMLERHDCVMLVAEVGGVIFGMAASIICPLWFNTSVMTGQEWFWYVAPDHRNGTGKPLLEALERETKALGAETFTMLSLATLRPEALERLYTRRGYRPAERTYIRRL